MIKFYYVYVLRSLKDGLFYIGYSNNLKQRVYDHNMGKNVSTKNRRPLELIFYEAFRNKADVLRRESYFKTTKGKVTLGQMLKEHLKPQKSTRHLFLTYMVLRLSYQKTSNSF